MPANEWKFGLGKRVARSAVAPAAPPPARKSSLRDVRATGLAVERLSPGGRLTLTSGTPVTTADVTGATSIYYTPYLDDQIYLWDGTRWAAVTFTEYTLALGTLTSGKPYDIFAYLSAGVLALEVLVWTNDTTRATAITIQDGRYCKSGDKTRLYLGTFYTTATTTTEDSLANRYLVNHYNAVARRLSCSPGYSDDNAGTNVSFTGATWTEINAGSNSRVSFLVPIGGYVGGGALWSCGGSGTGAINVGLGIDSVTAAYTQGKSPTSTNTFGIFCLFGSMFSAGKHYAAMLAYMAAGTGTIFADGGRATAAPDVRYTCVEASCPG